MVTAGGQTMIVSGQNLGESLAGLPLVGCQVRDVARDAFAGAGRPLSDFGTELEQFIFVIAIVLALLLALVTIAPWLYRYRALAMGAGPARPGRPPCHPHGPRHRRRRGVEHDPCHAGRRPSRLRHASRVHARSARRLDQRPPRPARSSGAGERGR